MLKKMRWRFIGAAMAAFSAVILTLLCLVNLLNYRTVISQQDDTLRMLAQRETEPAPPEAREDRHGRFSPEMQYMLRFFTVYCDAEGQVQKVNQDHIASITEDEAAQYAARALARGGESGSCGGYRYLRLATQEGSVLIFLNSEREISAVRSLLTVTALTAAGSLLIVFGLICALSRRAIMPYIRNLEAQKRFITDASHELKTPLTSISASADVLALEHEDDEWVKNIQFQCGRLSRLIANLVTLSRLDEENPFPKRAQFSLSDAVWEIAEPFSALARAKGKTYEQHIEDGLTMTGDRAAVQQMTSILLDNAVKYADEGGAICLDVHRDRKKLEIEVYNTYQDAQSIDLSRLFDRFYRPDSSHSRKTGGTGIGLSIAQATAQAHGGTISVQATNGGMLFRVKI